MAGRSRQALVAGVGDGAAGMPAGSDLWDAWQRQLRAAALKARAWPPPRPRLEAGRPPVAAERRAGASGHLRPSPRGLEARVLLGAAAERRLIIARAVFVCVCARACGAGWGGVGWGGVGWGGVGWQM